jgi:8-oxo-dGTP pyrophosphatase MutT (NUDIX family)/phosphohistidine phosphatase SixA
MSRTERILAAGGVLWRGPAPAPELALVHRPRYDDWSLPKGKLVRGEHPLTAAVREVREETGMQATVGRPLGRLRYPQTGPGGEPVDKVVHYWAMRADDGEFVANDEVDRLVWLPPTAALEQLSYQRDRRPVRRLLELPTDTTPVLLVRHARAGQRRQWQGADADRPLDTAGQRQAMLLRDLLTLFGPARVHSAPPLRCVQTVSPLADRLGLAVQEEPALSDSAASGGTGQAVRRLRAIAAAGQCAVVCSQGGTIPAVVGELGHHDRVRTGALLARKASVWALFFTGERLRAAGYLPDPEPALPL